MGGQVDRDIGHSSRRRMAVSVAMKVAPVSSGWSPHEDTTGMDSKPQAQFPSYNDDEQSYSNNAYQLDDGSIVVPQSLSEMTHEVRTLYDI